MLPIPCRTHTLPTAPQSLAPREQLALSGASGEVPKESEGSPVEGLWKGRGSPEAIGPQRKGLHAELSSGPHSAAYLLGDPG